MDLIDGLIGLIVLTGPLWLILLFVLTGTWIAFKVRRRFNSAGAKWAASAGVLALAFLLLFGDELAGRAYLNYLCATEAGIRVYHIVGLPETYWDDNGKPKFYDEKNGNFTLAGYAADYHTERYSSFLHINRAGYSRLDESGRVLGELIDFRFWGGWLSRNLAAHNTAIRCEGRREQSSRLVKQIFRKRS